jgi:alpha-1,3-mannosyltransferase
MSFSLKEGNDRITELAQLRNLVMDPLVRQPELYDRDTTVIFLNDVSICTDDILEMIYQKVCTQSPI